MKMNFLKHQYFTILEMLVALGLLSVIMFSLLSMPVKIKIGTLQIKFVFL